MKTKLMKVLLATVVSVMAFGMPVMAETKIMGDKIEFDSDYYAQNNPDAVAAFGSNFASLYKHYVMYGIVEGRTPNDYYDSEDICDIQEYISHYTTPGAVPVMLPSGNTVLFRQHKTEADLYQGVVFIDEANLELIKEVIDTFMLGNLDKDTVDIIIVYLQCSEEVKPTIIPFANSTIPYGQAHGFKRTSWDTDVNFENTYLGLCWEKNPEYIDISKY